MSSIQFWQSSMTSVGMGRWPVCRLQERRWRMKLQRIRISWLVSYAGRKLGSASTMSIGHCDLMVGCVTMRGGRLVKVNSARCSLEAPVSKLCRSIPPWIGGGMDRILVQINADLFSFCLATLFTQLVATIRASSSFWLFLRRFTPHTTIRQLSFV